MSTDLIFIDDIEIDVFIGVSEEERKSKTKIKISLQIETELKEAGKQDELSETIDYDPLYKIVQSFDNFECQLLEHLAYKIGSEIKKTINNQIIIIAKKQFYPNAGDIGVRVSL